MNYPLLRSLLLVLALCGTTLAQKSAKIAQKDLLGTWTLHTDADTLGGPMVPMMCTLWVGEDGQLTANNYYRAEGEPEQIYSGDLRVSYNTKTQILDLAGGDRSYRFYKATYLSGRLTLLRLADNDPKLKGKPYFVKEVTEE